MSKTKNSDTYLSVHDSKLDSKNVKQRFATAQIQRQLKIHYKNRDNISDKCIKIEYQIKKEYSA